MMQVYLRVTPIEPPGFGPQPRIRQMRLDLHTSTHPTRDLEVVELIAWHRLPICANDGVNAPTQEQG